MKKNKLNTEENRTVESLLVEIRKAFADYVKSEGCSCCQDTAMHQEAAERLGELLNVKKYPDGSGYNFYDYTSK